MFDLRYHVASLVAVFLALTIGILVGAGLASRVDVGESERRVLEERIEQLERNNRDLVAEADLLRRQREAVEQYVENTYDTVMNGRLRGTRVAVLVLGQVDPDALGSVEDTLDDASAPGVIELEALELPIDPQEIENALDPEFAGLSLEEVGRRLGQELIEGGETPFWDALTPVLVHDSRGTSTAEADAVVVSQTGAASDTPTREFLDGIYAGLARGGVPAVGIERTDARTSHVAVYKRNGISSVDSVDSNVGKVALAALLGGAREGHYGLKGTATDGPLPAIEPLPLAPPPSG